MNYQLLKTIIDTELKRFEIISEDEWAYKNSRRNGQERNSWTSL